MCLYLHFSSIPLPSSPGPTTLINPLNPILPFSFLTLLFSYVLCSLFFFSPQHVLFSPGRLRWLLSRYVLFFPSPFVALCVLSSPGSLCSRDVNSALSLLSRLKCFHFDVHFFLTNHEPCIAPPHLPYISPRKLYILLISSLHLSIYAL